MHNLPLAIIMDLSPTGLYAIREFGRSGIPVLGIRQEFGCGQFSRYLTHPDKYWKIKTENNLLIRLMKLVETVDYKPVLIPTSDYFISFISKYYSDLKDSFTFQKSYTPEIVRSLVNKDNFYELCQRHGLDIPLTWRPKTKHNLREMIGEIQFPIIFKPYLIDEFRPFLRGKKNLLMRSLSEFQDTVNIMPDDISKWLVQEVIPGPESNIYLFAGYFDQKGEPVQTFTARKLRQFLPGFGSASLAVSETNPEILDLSINFLKKIRFKGVCGIEFKFDPRDRKMKVMEINPRPCLWFNLTHSAGKRIVETAYLDFIGEKLPAESPQQDGILWQHVLRDIYSKIFYTCKGRKFVLPSPEIKAKNSLNCFHRSWAAYDRSDPLPALIVMVRSLLKILTSIFRWK